MKKLFLLSFLLFSLLSFSQKSKYWIKFIDKNHNTFSLSNPAQFLSQKSIDRRTKQNLQLNPTDLPLSETYIDSLSPFITELKHRIKWFNVIVVDMSDAITLHTDTTAWRDTIYDTDTFSVTVYDSIIIHRRINTNEATYTYDTITTSNPVAVYDTFIHPGPIYIRDTIVYTDVVIGNGFDSLKQFGFIDTIGQIKSNPTRAAFGNKKLEEVPPVNQAIVYPSKYGAAYHQINMLNADLLHQMGYTGEGITVSVMDNGFYNTNLIKAYDSVRTRILGTWDFVNNEANVYNDGSHGENVFSCMAANQPNVFVGTAPGADYYLFTTEDDNAEWVMEEYNWAAAAEVADSVGAQIFSTSLGYSNFDANEGSHTYADLDGHTTVITNAANMAFSKGILVINSAGNEGAKTWRYIIAPADGDSVLAIGAVDSTEKVVDFSSRGPNAAGRIKPDVCAQGRRSAVITTSGFASYSDGTSFSCPILSGCAASLWSAFPDKTAREIYDAIVISADHFWTPDNNHGYGIPNFYNAYLFLKTNYNSGILRVTDDAVVYPNPFSNQLNVSLFNTEAKNHRVELFNLLGQKVYDREFYVRNGTFEIVNIDAAGIAAGEYILRFDGEKAARPLLKVK
jgi:serine protease AprX